MIIFGFYFIKKENLPTCSSNALDRYTVTSHSGVRTSLSSWLCRCASAIKSPDSEAGWVFFSFYKVRSPRSRSRAEAAIALQISAIDAFFVKWFPGSEQRLLDDPATIASMRGGHMR